MALSSRSILSKLRWSMMGFGIAMGIIFPIYANLFVEWKPGLFPYFAAGAILAGITVGVANYFMVHSILLKQLNTISSLAAELSQKNLSQQLEIHSEDLVGKMVTDLNRGIQDLATTIHSVSTLSTLISETLQSISTKSHESSQNVMNVSNHAQQLQEHAEGFQIFSDQISQSISTLDTSLRAVSHVFEQIQTHVSGIVQQASRNTHLSTQAQETIRVLLTSFDGLNHHIQDMTINVEETMKVTHKTHLLSLNASIEASTAGEHGKGFAVIASEVRDLANHSREETNKLSQNIVIIQNLIHQAIQQLSTHQDALQESQHTAVQVNAQSQEIQTELQVGIRNLKDLESSSAHLRMKGTQFHEGSAQSVQNASSIRDRIRSNQNIQQQLDQELCNLANHAKSMDKVIQEFRT